MKNKIIALAIEQLGNDYIKYCNGMGYSYRIEWCACFISWLAKKLKITDIIPVDMSCNSQIKKFKALGVWHTDKNIQSGDILYYDWDKSGDADHVGIVEKSENGFLTVIEGNNGNYPNDRVRRRKINSESSLIFGYARPDYSRFENKISFPLLRKGDIGTYVKILQAFLTAYKNSEIDVDGIVGENTWNKLMN